MDRKLQFAKMQWIVFLSFYTVSLFAQSEVPTFIKEVDWLGEKDSKKWEKLIAKHVEADNLMVMSNNAYLQAGTVNSDQSIPEKKKEKQVVKLEGEAATKYLTALKSYKEVYTALYDILTDQMQVQQTSHPAYTDMEELSNQAEVMYGEMGSSVKEEDKENLSRANELKLSAIKKGTMIYTVVSSDYNSVSSPGSSPGSNLTTESVNEYQNGGTTPSSTTTGTADYYSTSAPGDEVTLNTEMYQKYKDYLNDPSIPEPLSLAELLSLNTQDPGFDTFEEIWQQYLDGNPLVKPTQEVAQKMMDSLAIAGVEGAGEYASEENIAPVAEGTSITGTPEPTTEVVNTTEPTDQSDVVAKEEEQQILNLIKEEITSAPNKTSGLSGESAINDLNEFRVQVAAGKSPLSMAQLKAIYSGELTVVELNEGSYFKYQIRGFKRLNDAQGVCSGSGVKNAYLTAYNESGMMPLAQAVKSYNSNQYTGRFITFSVQIAASRVKLTSDQIARIYSGGYEVSVVFEEDWYKYQVLAGNNLQQALSILENSGVPKAFLVAYEKGKKQKLYRALQDYKKYKR